MLNKEEVIIYMLKIFRGPTGSGKTSLLQNKYNELSRDKRTDNSIVFLKNAASVSQWRKEIELSYMGPLNIFTYFGFIQKELKDRWIEIEKNLSGSYNRLEPTFMTVETAHFVMSKYVEKKRKGNDIFDYINATPSQIAVQLIDNLNYAAMNCLDFVDMQKRLIKWSGSDLEKRKVFKEVLSIMKIFRKFCLKNRVVDYSLLITLYNRELLDNKVYLSDLKNRYDYLFVDDLEKTVPAGQNLFDKILDRTDRGYMAFNPEEGINRFFGGNPFAAKEKFLSKAEIIELDSSYTASKEARKMAEELKESVFSGEFLTVDYIVEEIDTELRGDMLVKTAEKVVELIDNGIKPGEIAIIAPTVDKVMEFTLEHFFEKRGYSLYNLKSSKRLVDIPFAQALITLTILTNPTWNINLDYSSLHHTLSLVLKLDPIRSGLLTDEIFKNSFIFPDLDDTELRDEIGFANSEKYEHLKKWIEEKKVREIEIDHFFQLVFGELLAPLSPTEEDIFACRQMIDSIKKFKNVVGSFKEFEEKELGKDFIDMIYNGTLAAEVLYKKDDITDNILLSTPYKFLVTPEIESVKYLFLLDISSEGWLKSIAKELSNPYIFSPQWRDEKKWDDELDQNLRKKQLIEFLQSVLSRSKKGVFLVDSYLDSRGWEQEGRLYEWLHLEQEVIKND